MSAQQGLIADPLFVGLTRPPLKFGVTDLALIANVVVTMELFLVTRNLLLLLVALPIHALCALLCARDARFFDLALLWARTRLPAFFLNFKIWRASSYSPCLIDLPSIRGRRRLQPVVRVAYRRMKRERA